MITPIIPKQCTEGYANRPSIPPIAGHCRLARTLGNLLVLIAAVLGGEWILHQILYRLQYGSRFNAIMATTPHRFYMEPLGVAYAALTVGMFAVAAAAITVATWERRTLLRLVPPRLRRHASHIGTGTAWSAITRTALLLGVAQISLYLIQENLETYALSGGLPGLSPLLPAAHPVVLPLGLAIATLCSLIRWSLSSRLGSVQRAVHLARALVRLFGIERTTFSRPILWPIRIPDPRPHSGSLGPRAPPRFA